MAAAPDFRGTAKIATLRWLTLAIVLCVVHSRPIPLPTYFCCTIYMYDSYGDGWGNGNTIAIVNNNDTLVFEGAREPRSATQALVGATVSKLSARRNAHTHTGEGDGSESEAKLCLDEASAPFEIRLELEGDYPSEVSWQMCGASGAWRDATKMLGWDDVTRAWVESLDGGIDEDIQTAFPSYAPSISLVPTLSSLPSSAPSAVGGVRIFDVTTWTGLKSAVENASACREGRVRVQLHNHVRMESGAGSIQVPQDSCSICPGFVASLTEGLYKAQCNAHGAMRLARFQYCRFAASMKLMTTW